MPPLEFSGEIRKRPRHLCQGRNNILRGTTLIPRTVTRCALPASNKATTCNGVIRPALLCCHAAPVHNARFRCDSGKTRSHFVGSGLLPSLRSIRAAHDGSALLRFKPAAPGPVSTRGLAPARTNRRLSERGKPASCSHQRLLLGYIIPGQAVFVKGGVLTVNTGSAGSCRPEFM